MVMVALAAAPCAFPRAAAANPRQLERALSLYDAGQLNRALTAFEQALSEGDNDEVALRTIYLHLGILRAGTGNAAAAQEEFSRLLALDPDATLPPDSSPVVTEPFERARSAARSSSDLDLEIHDGGDAPAPSTHSPMTTTGAPRSGDRPVRSGSILKSPWFWGGAAAFVAAAVFTTVWVASDSGRPYVAVGGIETR